MKVYIDSDEWYPVYSVEKSPWGIEVDVPEEVLERWDQVFCQFRNIQSEMAALVVAAEKST